MSTPDKTQNALQTSNKPRSLQDLIRESSQEIGKALPSHMNPERVVRIALTCIRQTPDLAKCTPESFLGALFTAAQLGIEPIAGRAYLLPFFNNRQKPDGSWHKVQEVEFVLGYKGVADLFYRHEKAVNLEWGVVKENDLFEYERGTNSFLRHREAEGDRGAIKGFWVMANLLHGGKPFHYMTAAEALEHGKKHSKTWNKKKQEWYDGSPWVDDFESMSLKTVLVQLCKILPLSVELQHAISQDETSRAFRKGIDNVLDLPDQVNWDKVADEVAQKTEEAMAHEENKNTENLVETDEVLGGEKTS